MFYEIQAFWIVTVVMLLYAKLIFFSPIFHNGTLYGSQIGLSITFEPVGTFAYSLYHLKGKWVLLTSL